MDDSSLPTYLRLLVPKIPLLLSTTLANTLYLSYNSNVWDLRTELTIALLRSIISTRQPRPIGQVQRLTLKDPGIYGRKWVAKTTFPVPSNEKDEEGQCNVRKLLWVAFDRLCERGDGDGDDKNGAGLEEETFTRPELRPVEVEWTGYRAGVAVREPQPEVSELEKYRLLMREVESDVTILYLHGGAYYLCDPASHRRVTARLAKLTKGRCLSVRYRLAPQHPFPAALLDALVAYLSLLHPPPGSFHAAVPASKIVFSGDSAGGGLCMALLQLLLSLRQPSAPPCELLWLGATHASIPLPAGLTLNSAWLDLTHSLPSIERNARYDYLPTLAASHRRAPFPPDDVWPTSPPRQDIYADASALTHPLVSPVAAPSWAGSPPLLLLTGQEMLSDESRFVAARAAAQAVPVVFYEFRAMPHCFCLLLDNLPASRRCYDVWAAFARDCVEAPETVVDRAGAVLVEPKSLREERVELAGLSSLGLGEVKRGMREVVRRRKEGLEGEGTALPKV